MGGQDQSSDGLVETTWKLLSYVKRFVGPAFEIVKGSLHSMLDSGEVAMS